MHESVDTEIFATCFRERQSAARVKAIKKVSGVAGFAHDRPGVITMDMSFKRFHNLFALFLSAVVMIMFLGAPSARAADTLDYQQGSGGSLLFLRSDQWLGTPYPAGLTGGLTKVTLDIWRTGTPADLTIQVFASSAGFPVGTPLATQSLTTAELASVPSTRGSIDIVFSAPASVVAGTTYVIVASTTTTSPNVFNWNYGIGTGVSGISSTNQGGSWLVDAPVKLGFKTYVDTAWIPPTNVESSSPTPTRTLTFIATEGSCITVPNTGPDSTWIRVPTAAECFRAGYALQGWATSSAFPVTQAADQVRRGWGAIDETINGLRMIFIPAGGFTELSADNVLYSIWSRNS